MDDDACIEFNPQPAAATLSRGERVEQLQIRETHGAEAYYLYEHDADPDQVMEIQFENAGPDGAAESFLLPELRTTQPYPWRCRYIGPMGWDLVDPKGLVDPVVIAMTYDGRRFLVGLVDWDHDENRTLGAHWESLGGTMRTDVATTWAQWRRDKGVPHD